jgi:UDP-N-acetylmuramyl pentapeptide phosphotransferase/UDP-N-acetylglucosamine-1-phosphate transferase
MSITIHGIDGVLVLIAVLCFAAAGIISWVSAEHRLYYTLMAAGLFCWSLTGILR